MAYSLVSRPANNFTKARAHSEPVAQRPGRSRHAERSRSISRRHFFGGVILDDAGIMKKSRRRKVRREILRERHDGAVIQWMRDPP
jgi:hypothetical protein